VGLRVRIAFKKFPLTLTLSQKGAREKMGEGEDEGDF